MALDLASERAALVALLHPPREFKWAGIRNVLIEEESTPSELLQARLDGGEFGNFSDELAHASRRIAQWEADGTHFLTYMDPGYPRQLKEVHDLPPFLFARGTLHPENRSESGVSIVGSREASAKALADASQLAAGLVRNHITVVSGLAAGIDAAAHSTALAMGGRTVGVIGTGIDRYYPKTSEPMQKRMERGEGLVLSQFWPGASPTRFSFPMRNAVMSAFSRVTVIVEASEKSGTRHQATRALAHGRPLILSDSVVRETSWGRKLASDPARLDVTVISSLGEAIDVAVAKAQPVRVVDSTPTMSSAAW